MIEAVRNWRLLQSLRAGSSRSPGDLERLQASLLRQALAHAYEQVPFYERVWDEAGFDPRSLDGLAEIERVPVITGSMVREAGERGELLARGVDAARRPPYTTSGFSGQSLSVPRMPLEERLRRVGRLRIWFEHGYRWRQAAVYFDRNQGPSHPLQRLGIARSTWIPTGSAIAEQLAAFTAARADVVVGAPTALRRLCSALEATVSMFVRPRIVFSQGEVLDSGTRAQVERVLGAAPIEVYALTEVGYVAWQCELRGALHVSADLCLAEVRRGGRAARPGELGALVLTDLRGRSMPMLRYDTGDLAVAAAGPCPCGRSLPLIQSVEGRARSAVTRADGRVLTMRAIVDHLAGALPPDLYRLHQETETQFRLQIAPGPAGEADRLMSRLSELLGGAEIRFAGDLSAAANGTQKSQPVSSAVACDLA
jgi:phenylacetate-CoA ligase